MTREEEIFKEAWEYFHDTLRKLDIVKCSPMGDWTEGLVRGFIKGAKWADNNPRMFKGQTEQMEEREIAFMDWRLENHKGKCPTFADAIAWADKTMINKACQWLEENYYNVYQGTWQEIKEQFINDFKKSNGGMIMEDFVPYELALKLKDKGFRKPCIATYDKDGMLGYNYVQPTSIHAVGFEECLVYSNDCVMAPTISQVLKWLREEKKLHIELWAVGKKPIKWCHTITTLNHVGEKQGWSSGKRGDSYEAAAIAGIEYVIDNLI